MAKDISNEAQSTKLKVFFHALDEMGHINACVGLAQELAKRGHRITFIQDDSFAGQFAKLGFDEILLKQQAATSGGPTTDDIKGPNEVIQTNPVKEMGTLRLKYGFFEPKTPLEKLKLQMTVAKETELGHQMLYRVMRYNSLIEQAIEREKPDMFILDSFMLLPAIRQANIPWILLFSSNPIPLYQSDELPPSGSGYATTSDPESWQEYSELTKLGQLMFRNYKTAIYEKFNIELSEEEKCSHKLFFDLSPYLNIYGYPAELDYDDIVVRPTNLAQLDSFCRVESDRFEVPEMLNFEYGVDKLIYFSLGSECSIDVDLMKRIVSVLAQTPHKYIVSKGQRGDEYELPGNCWGENFVPQTAILPLVDLVITHAGNNTITETLSHGKPMIAIPMFSEQYDNAQRVHENGYGIRLEPYQFSDGQLIDAINRVLNDAEMKSKAKSVAQRMAKSNRKEKVVEQLEQIVANFQMERQ